MGHLLFVFLFVLAYAFDWMFFWVSILLIVFWSFTMLELFYLFASRKKITAIRQVPDKFSNGDQNSIILLMKSDFKLKMYAVVIDELPEQFQSRTFEYRTGLEMNTQVPLNYVLRPLERGVYNFGAVHIFASTWLGLVQRRFSGARAQTVKCYPSFLALRGMDIRAIANEHVVMGSRKIRRLGSSMEFEQIKEYVIGDDVRNINWKSTAKRGQLMVNQFQDEKSQDIYVAIDTGRTMEMPFNGLSLLDYSINASLMLLSVVLEKYDRAGMFTFGRKIDNKIVADKRPNQMQRMLESLYAIDTKFEETNFASLYVQIKKDIRHRSLLILFTNFESYDGLQRNLPYLVALNKNHLVLVVFFKNEELNILAQSEALNKEQLSERIVAAKFEHDKRVMAKELSRHGVLTLLTGPSELNLDVINKYLEVKSRGLI